jgi:hypothetical protein
MLAGLLLAACSKTGDGAPAPAASAQPAASVSAPVASAAPAVPTPVSWTGHYSATPGPFYVPDGGEWAGVHFRGEDASVGLGEGTLSATVDPGGRVTGTLEGPLGPLLVTGLVAGKAFSAELTPKEPATGFTGAATGAIEGDKITGTMRLSLPTGNVIRMASFTLDRTASPSGARLGPHQEH